MDELRVIDDIVMTPTYTMDASEKIWDIITSEMEYGTYHVSNSGLCTWYEFANSIFEFAGIDQKVIPVNHEEYPTIASRPLWSPLASEKGSQTRHWKEGLEDFVKLIS